MPPSGISTTSSDASSSGDSAKSLSSPSWWIAGSVAAGVGLGAWALRRRGFKLGSMFRPRRSAVDDIQPHHAWSDDRKYRLITLRSNGLKVLLIHDRETEKGSASMSVHVGHFSDPDDRPGLAHFCEHMLFLGTEKYPEEAEYKRYLAEYGGRSNASTSTEGTTFQFDVVADHLEGALDRFSQFFTAPLFTESCTSRKSTPSIQNFNSSTMMMGEECGSFSRACRRAEILE